MDAVFGNPAAGTAVIVAAPSAATDQPLKVLVWEDEDRQVWISYNSPAYVPESASHPDELMLTLRGVDAVAEQARA